MDEGPIRHISDTADWIAAYRALESQRRDALFRDPLAALLAGEHGKDIAAEMGGGRMLAWSVALRTAVVDDFVTRAVQDGADAVLNLGAGLDARPYRLDLPADLLWVEADFPQVIESKSRQLADHTPRCHLERTALDLVQASERQQLFHQIAARASRVLVITEGVVPYFTLEETAALATDLAAEPRFALWTLDYFSPLLMAHYRKGHMRRPLGRNVPFRFDPDDWEGFFADAGWAVRDLRYLAEEGRLRGRRMPVPWPYALLRPLMLLMPRGKRQEMERMSGYALLERRRDEAKSGA